MKAKLNNLIARYEAYIARMKAESFYSDMRYTQIVMKQGFVHDLKSLLK